MKSGMEIIPVAVVDDVLKHALVRPLVPIEWDETVVDAAKTAAVADEDKGSGLTAH